MTLRVPRVVSRRGTPSRALLRNLSLPPRSRCPTSGPPGSATAPPTWSRAAWSSAAWACPTPRSTASSTAPVRPRSASLFLDSTCTRHHTRRVPRACAAATREPSLSAGTDRSTLAGRRDDDARLVRALETARPTFGRMQQRRRRQRRWQRRSRDDRVVARVVAESNTAQKTPNARDNRFFAR